MKQMASVTCMPVNIAAMRMHCHSMPVCVCSHPQLWVACNTDEICVKTGQCRRPREAQL